MVTRQTRLRRAFVALGLIVYAAAGAGSPLARAGAQAPPSRIVSLVPNLTDILVAIGARPQLAAVSSYDDEPEVKDLPRVGALLDPDVERILSLRPDLVLVYGSQTDLMTQLRRASIPIFDYRHGGIPHITGTIRDLGRRTGRSLQAEKLAGDIERRIREVAARVSGRPKVRTLLVFGRERATLRGIYASGGRGFLHEMLEAAGGVNVYGDVDAESVQVSTEMILSRAPEGIIELRSKDIPSQSERAAEIASWNALAGVPAIRSQRVFLLTGKSITVPGPLVADGILRMARALHPEAFK